MDNLLKEIDNKFSKMSIDDIDGLINDMENIKITKKKKDNIDDLINSMSSLNMVSNNEKKKVMLQGIKKHRNKVFAKKYKSLSGKKTELTQNQIDDIFATMNALKKGN